MKITSFHIDGFGALADVGYEAITPGLVVVLGPNEAGKSTLFDFIAGVLFGFPTRKSDAAYRSPTHGGRHGGRIGFVDDSGGQWLVERHAGPHKSFRVRLPDGSSGDEDDLARALAGGSTRLFRAVFAVSLDALGGMETLEEDEVRELLFTASIFGQRRSAASAMKHLGDRRDSLARPRREDAAANRLQTELECVRNDLASARREATGFGALRTQAAGLDAEVVKVRSRLRSLRARERELQLLSNSWQPFVRARTARCELEELPACAKWDLLLRAEPEIRALAAEHSGHVERTAKLAELARQRSGLATAISSDLSRLGPEWSVDRALASVEPRVLEDHVRTCRKEMARLSTDVASAAAVARQADDLLATAVASESSVGASVAATLGVDNEPPSRSALEQAMASSSELRDRLLEIDRLQIEAIGLSPQRLGASADSPRESSAAGRLASLVLAAACLVLLVVAALAFSGGQPWLGAVAAVVALGLGASALVVSRYDRSAAPDRAECAVADEPPAAQRLASVMEVAAREQQTADELARLLGLSRPSSRIDAERHIERLQRLLGARRDLEEVAGAVAAASRRAQAARSAQDSALVAVERERRAFAKWRESHGLPADASPDETLETIARLGELREHARALRRVEPALERLGDEVTGYLARVSSVDALIDGTFRTAVGSIDRLSHAPETADAQLASLVTMLQEAVEGNARRVAASNELAGASSALDEMLGSGASAARLRVELGSGDVLAWQSELAAVSTDLEELTISEERLVRDHQSVIQELTALATSDRIAALELREAELDADLDEALKSYLVLGTAKSLLQRTLSRHERERQPAVIASAAHHFERVTAGRYRGLIADQAQDGHQTIRAISASGAEIDAASLSRGTLEQLYLCLRFGLADSFAERATSLPIVLDDVLVNFDPDRAEATAAELAATAGTRQVVMMTCHPELAEMALRACSEGPAESQLIELKRIA